MRCWGIAARPSDVLLRVERAESALLVASARFAPSPEVVVRDFGGPAAIVMRGRPNTLFNRAMGIAAADARIVARIVEHDAAG